MAKYEQYEIPRIYRTKETLLNTIALVNSALRDENGVSELVFHALLDVIEDNFNVKVRNSVSRATEATDGRFYFDHDEYLVLDDPHHSVPGNCYILRWEVDGKQPSATDRAILGDAQAERMAKQG